MRGRRPRRFDAVGAPVQDAARPQGAKAAAVGGAAGAAAAERVGAIDAFRGWTMLVMVFVNDLASVAGMPAWLRHMPATADAMTVVDAVFPAFLFAVGLSIPFALAHRRARGAGAWSVQRHVAARTAALLVMGVFMVNTEGGAAPAAMPLSIHAWALWFCAAAWLVWGTSPWQGRWPRAPQRAAGVALLVALAWVWRGGPDGSERIAPQWWGILGLIGWAYLLGCLGVQAARGRVAGVLAAVGVCLAYDLAARAAAGAEPPLRQLLSQGGNAVHASIVLLGAATALLLVRRLDGGGAAQAAATATARRAAALRVLALAAVCAVAAAWLRPRHGISKIGATPSWALFSAAGCMLMLLVIAHWPTALAAPPGSVRAACRRWLLLAASEPLLVYLLPFAVEHAMQLAGLDWPAWLHAGVPGPLRSAAFAVLLLGVAAALVQRGCRLRL